MARLPALAASLVLTFCCAPAVAQQPPAPAATPPAAAPPGEGTPEITVSGQSKPVDPIDGPTVFLSPMGEPFRSEDKLSGAEHWFVQADKDNDRRVTKAEFQADAARFFATIDTDHDGVIGPEELLHYETDIAPEVMVTSTYGDVSKIKVDSDGKLTDPPYPTRLGAGRYSWIITPEPVIAADANMDRGVTKLEFEVAAAARFKILDRNGDGVLVRAELPKLSTPRGGQ
ncbi:hypothetical protein Q4F19_18805 [Sphingomonas sp. BIUV-7]|uniref:EF-hand domain-containing protein n=1 Tax=Sphingomonas natans TaxID=3063330 RepID=A0ABT8YDP2_9SPHN|nr:hypothetical protein [Sphingomonas sp. BIUV-7]MDO6416441.1 hypothetical protein [Sphingomonas sp. BIUV-7]